MYVCVHVCTYVCVYVCMALCMALSIKMPDDIVFSHLPDCTADAVWRNRAFQNVLYRFQTPLSYPSWGLSLAQSGGSLGGASLQRRRHSPAAVCGYEPPIYTWAIIFEMLAGLRCQVQAACFGSRLRNITLYSCLFAFCCCGLAFVLRCGFFILLFSSGGARQPAQV